MKNRTTRIASYAVVLRERKILLCRLSKQVPKWAGYWTLPGGGIEFGESPEHAMVRELLEETGFDVAPVNLLGIESFHSTSDGGEYHGIRIIYHARITGGSMRPELKGSTDTCEWFDLDGEGPGSLQSLPLVELTKAGLRLINTAGIQ